VAVEYGDDDDDRMLASRVAAAVRRLYQNGCPGDVLVFLPGAGEIRRAGEILGPWALQNGAVVLPLHGDLGPAEQRRAVSRCSRRKVILSTNVAETSLTIDGVVAVVDSGLARLASHSPWSGLPRVAVGKISQASAIQRAGRAGRTCPGQVVRLYSRQDFDGRRPFEVPEIGRLDMSEALLTLAALGVANADQFAWFEPPPAAALAAAGDLLRKLGALDNSGRLTTIGREMLRFPAHPRLARLLVEGQRRGVGEEAAALAGIISEGDISQSARARFDHPQRHALAAEGGDLLERLDRFEQARSARFAAGQVRGLGLDGAAVSAVERARRQYAAGLAREGKSQAARPPASPEAVDAALARATLAAFPDRVMKRRGRDAGQAVLVTGGAVETPALPAGELLVAVDVEERGGPSGRPGGSARQARLAVAIEPDWLLDQVPEGLDEVEEMLWNGSEERVELVSRLSYGAVVLLESRRPAPPSTQASRCLAEVALATETEPANSAALLTTLKVKLEILRTVFPELAVPAFDPEWVRAALIAACAGITSLAELRIVPIGERLQSGLGQAVLARLRGDTPDHIALGRRQVAVNYQPDRHPWIEARLQDFFGMKAGPAICRGRLPLTMHLLAPNRRAVQVTSDLAGFWQRHYPAIRQELCRRYPRHAWPEDGASAVPPVSPARR
jgi:ATP-dependent helicase HrpB